MSPKRVNQLPISRPQFYFFIVWTGYKANPWNFTKLPDDIPMRFGYFFLKFAFKPNSNFCILWPSYNNPVWKGKDSNRVAVPIHDFDTFASPGIPDSCSAIPRATHKLFRYGLAQGIDSTRMSFKSQNWVSFIIDVQYFLIFTCWVKSLVVYVFVYRVNKTIMKTWMFFVEIIFTIGVQIVYFCCLVEGTGNESVSLV